MPSPLDDLPVHQTAAPLPEPATSDTHFNDGYYFAFYAPGFHVFAGLRLHPNTNVMDGYGGAVAHGTQRNLRVSRALRPSTYPFKVGPLQLEILEPMRRQRVALQANESGVSFDVTFTAVAPPFDETPHRQYRHGRLHNHVLRYTQVARAHGTLTIDDATHAIDGWHAARDHSWGIRSTMGPHIPARGIGPGSDPDRRALPALGAVRDERPQRLLPHARGRTREHARLRGPDRLQGRRLARARARGARPDLRRRPPQPRHASPSPTRPTRPTPTPSKWPASPPTRRASATRAGGRTAASRASTAAST